MNKDLHLFIKFHEDGQGEFQGIKTMEEHLKVLNEKGKMCWGHFTANSSKKGLWDKKIKIIESQIEFGNSPYVFFCDRESQMLFVGKYIETYKRAEVENNHPIIEYIPKYYHHKIGTPVNDIKNELRSYAYIVVSDIKQIDIKKTEYIYSNTNRKKILDSEGMASILYVNFSDELFNELIESFKEEVSINIDKKLISEIDEVEYQNYMEKINVNKNIVFNDKPETINNNKNDQKVGRWNRNPQKAKNVVAYNDYKCEFDDKHKYFISNVTRENYVEAHHLIPMEYQEQFMPISLDVEANITCLCVVCHKKLHHGTYEEKKKIIEKLYNKRKDRLRMCGIEISFDELLKLYKTKK